MTCQEAKAREQVTVGSSEKQKIIMQISAVQTDIKRNMEERSQQDIVCKPFSLAIAGTPR